MKRALYGAKEMLRTDSPTLPMPSAHTALFCVLASLVMVICHLGAPLTPSSWHPDFFLTNSLSPSYVAIVGVI